MSFDPRITAILNALSLEEKAKLCCGCSFDGDPRVAGYTYPVPRFSLPQLLLSDSASGVNTSPISCLSYPCGTAVASPWNPALSGRIAALVADEALSVGVHVILGPGVNIHRSALGGRNFEYYSEDPLLAGRIAAAFCTGLQSSGVSSCVKHFAANNQETNRQSVDMIVSQRALREIYLRPFELAIRTARPWFVMTAYNALNGTNCSENADLVGVLRGEWGFEGGVMTDWESACSCTRTGLVLCLPQWRADR
jgi:beta-glucosidase